jgi:hypothetical protein
MKRKRAGQRDVSRAKKAARCRSVILFEDEASFWQDGSLHRTWSRVGVYGVSPEQSQVRVPLRVGLQWADVPQFLRQLALRHDGRKVFLVIDNAPCHGLDDNDKR